MNKQSILKNVKKAGEAAARNTQPIYRYLQPARNALSRLTAQWKPDGRLLYQTIAGLVVQEVDKQHSLTV